MSHSHTITGAVSLPYRGARLLNPSTLELRLPGGGNSKFQSGPGLESDNPGHSSESATGVFTATLPRPIDSNASTDFNSG